MKRVEPGSSCQNNVINFMYFVIEFNALGWVIPINKQP